MNRLTTVTRLPKWLSIIAAIILVAMPFHAFFTVWLSSAIGHYTQLRLWKEFLLVVLLASTVYLLVSDKQLATKFWRFWPARLALIYTALLAVWALVPLLSHHVTAKAMWYGLLVNLRFLLFFLAVWVVAQKSKWLKLHWRPLVLAPAMVVASVAILQFLVLPFDFFKHFGYGADTISPYETINHNIDHLRSFATLRGANPLGAYLVIPISVLAALMAASKKRLADGLAFGLGLGLALIFSFSRSAWIGGAISLFIVAWAGIKSPSTKKRLALMAGVIIIFGGVLAVASRNTSTFQNVFSHTENNSKIAVSSNQGHQAAFTTAVKDISRSPWGSGVGTAGPASVYNNKPPRIAENYYLQVAQEAGIFASLLFVAICGWVGWLLWQGRTDPLSLALFASLVGISFINLLSHAWTDDTLAYIWWGLAGIALATPAVGKQKAAAGK